MIKKWEEMSRDELNSLDRENTIVLLPLSATEQHGPHLPVGTDALILRALVDKIVREGVFEKGNLVFAPQTNVGKSNCHMGFGATITYTAKTYYDIVFELAKSVAAHGFKKIVLLNSHGGNTDALNLVNRDIRVELGLRTFVFDWWFTDFWRDGLKDIQQSGKYGVFHACELETSLMLACRPDLVDMTKAVDEDPNPLFQGKYVNVFGPVNPGWATKDVTKSGVIGAPTFATAEKGEKLFAYAKDKLLEIFGEIAECNY